MIGQLHELKEQTLMAWHYDARHRCFMTSLDGWRLLIQQTRRKSIWRAAVVGPPAGLARIAPAVFTSRMAAQAWCLAAIRQEQREGATGS
jgi:hypothetical protein